MPYVRAALRESRKERETERVLIHRDQNENESDEMRLESDEKINPSSVVLCLRL
jgi:hypothetical protein